MSEWKELSTYPNDGRWFFVIGGEWSRPAYARCVSPGNLEVESFRVVHGHTNSGEVEGDRMPTHWMPMPEPPSE